MSVLATTSEISALFRQMLMGRSVTVAKIPPFAISPSDPSATAVYVTLGGKVAGVCISDLQLIHRAGAALCLIPADSRLDSLTLDDGLAENFTEVSNISANLFRDLQGRRISLREIIFNASSIPPEISTLISAPKVRLDVKVTISDYGSGRMSLLAP